MKKYTKIIAIMFVMAILSSICILPASAMTFTSVRKTNYFSSSWQLYNNYYCGTVKVGKLTYGFNMFGTDEDYSKAISYNGGCQSAIQRIGTDSSLLYGPVKSVENTSTKEVEHLEDDVIYGILWSNNFSTITIG